MALLQISEPGMAPEPHQRQVAVGIDLGTTNSLVAAVRNSVAEVLPDLDGDLLLPSVVRYLPTGNRQIGRTAKLEAASDPKNTIVSVKRLMGRGKSDVEGSLNAPYDFVDAPGMVQIATVDGIKSPVEVSAEILATLRQRAEDTLDTELMGAVITVPAYFDEAQRQATKDAAQLAGINVLRLLNEPTAAAIAYGLDNGAEGVYAVYDLGGGTFDVSVLRLTRGVFEVLATGGDSALGGDDFDQLVVAYIARQAELDEVSRADIRLMLDHARSARELLSSQSSVEISLTLANGRSVRVELDEASFIELTQTLVQRTVTATRKVLRDAQTATDEIKGLVLVGGATRMPVIRRAVEQFFARPPLTDLNPDQVVALGAAIQADMLAGNRRGEGDDWLLLDVTPLSLGVETMGGLVEKIVPRNSTIPVARAQEFTTYKDGQTAMAIHVLQGERELASDCRSLARFELRGLPPMAAGGARIRVTYQVDADGLLSVFASELHSGVSASVIVKPSYGLADDEIARMLEDSFKTAEFDLHARALREAQVEAGSLLGATRAALQRDGELLDSDERATIEAALTALDTAAAGSDADAIVEATRHLARATDDFAARRMDKGIKAALKGRKISEV